MDYQLEDFKTNIIIKYYKDINNLFMFQDYLVLENLEECNKIISETFDNEEEKIISRSDGNFSILINKKFLILAKKDILVIIFTNIYKFLLKLTKNIDSLQSFIISNIKELLSLINLVLIFNDNMTFYALKKKILLLIVNNNKKDEIKNINEILLNEYYFTYSTNKKCRKSAISWDYKYFLFYYFKNDIIFLKEENNILDLLKDQLNIVGMKKEIFYDNIFVLKDLEIMNEINIVQSRNYHMWGYLRKIFNEINKEEKILIILYAFLTLKKCSFDYSAFSFIVNLQKFIPLEKEQIKAIIEDVKKGCFIKYDEHKCYIDNLDKFFESK